VSSPAAVREIAAIVSKLLSHFWTADDPAATRQAQISDWIADLEEFSLEIVAKACAEWRRRPGARRPLPGDIRAICIELRELRSVPPKSTRSGMFPSEEHHAELRHRIHEQGLAPLPNQDRLEWHAYDYAWRIERLDDHTPRSPIDRNGDHYRPVLVEAARSMWRKSPRRRFENDFDYYCPTPEQRAHFERQNQERRQFCAQFLATGDHLPDGRKNPMIDKYIELCVAQAHENLGVALRRGRPGSTPGDGAALNCTREALSVSTGSEQTTEAEQIGKDDQQSVEIPRTYGHAE
jgi:hypothetical protein